MTFWLDAHLDPKLASWLGATFGVIAKSVDEIGLRYADADVIFEGGKWFGKIVIMTADSDFVSLVQRLGAPPQILWLSIGNMRTTRMQEKLRTTFQDALELLGAGDPLVEIA